MTALASINNIQYKDICDTLSIPEASFKQWLHPLSNIPEEYISVLSHLVDSYSAGCECDDTQFELFMDKFDFWYAAEAIFKRQDASTKNKILEENPAWLAYISPTSKGNSYYYAGQTPRIAKVLDGSYMNNYEWDFLKLNLQIGQRDWRTLCTKLCIRLPKVTADKELLSAQVIYNLYGMCLNMRYNFKKENITEFRKLGASCMLLKNSNIGCQSKKQLSQLLPLVGVAYKHMMTVTQFKWFSDTLRCLTVKERSGFEVCVEKLNRDAHIPHTLSPRVTPRLYHMVLSPYWKTYYEALKSFVY